MYLFTCYIVNYYLIGFYREHRLLSFNHILNKTASEFYEELFEKKNIRKEAWKTLNLLVAKKQYKM